MVEYLTHHWIELTGYTASLFVAVSFFMKTIIPLRLFAIVSNVFFIIYGLFGGLLPVLLLHLLLFPLNLVRLVQMQRLTRQIEAAADGELEMTALIPYMQKQTYAAGEYLFHKGDQAEAMYYIAAGQVRLVELDKRLGEHKIIGEMGIFSPFRERTASALCDTAATVYSIDEARIKELYYQNPAFGFHLIKLLTRRFMRNLDQSGKLL